MFTVTPCASIASFPFTQPGTPSLHLFKTIYLPSSRFFSIFGAVFNIKHGAKIVIYHDTTKLFRDFFRLNIKIMANIATIHDRIALLVKKKANNKNTVFAQTLGVSEANIRGYIKGVVPKADVLAKIVSSYDDINPSWLLTGEGEMLKSGTPNPSEASPSPSKAFPNTKTSEKISNAEDTTAFLSYMEKKDGIIKEKDTIIEQKNQEITHLKCEVTRLEGENQHLSKEIARLRAECAQQSSDTPRSHTA